MTSRILTALLAVGLAFLFAQGGAQAQVPQNNNHTWVSRGGTDGTSCGAIDNPCRTLSYSVSRTVAGGQIECLDTVDAFNLSVSKSLTITCDASKWSNSIVTTFYTAASINVSATDVVTLRGIRLDGARVTSSSYDGLTFSGAGTLILDNVQITGFSGNGLLFKPSGLGKLVVSNSFFAANGNFGSNAGAAIRVFPQPGGAAQASIRNSEFARNVFGVAVDGSNSTSGINTTIRDSTSASNANDGFIAVSSSSTAPVGVTVVNSTTSNNSFGVRSIGSNVTVRLDGTKVIGNGTGLSGGGALLSLGNNFVEANAADGSFSGFLTFK